MVYGHSWKQFGKDLVAEVKEDNVSNGAAALAFYLLLALFPAMIALLTVIPYLPIPNLQDAIMDFLHQSLPSEAANMLAGTVESVVSSQRGGLLTVGLLLTIWSASSGLYAIMQQLNITYDVKEGRSFLKARATALLLTVIFGVLVIGAFTLIIGGGLIQDWLVAQLGFGGVVGALFAALRWVIILAALLLAFALTYYIGPDVEQKFRFVSPGSAFGVVGLCLAALAFGFYVSNFANYSAVYGSIGAVIILLFWLYLTGLVLLLGSEVNALIEHYSTDGKRKGEKRQTEGRTKGSPLHPQPQAT